MKPFGRYFKPMTYNIIVLVKTTWTRTNLILNTEPNRPNIFCVLLFSLANENSTFCQTLSNKVFFCNKITKRVQYLQQTMI